jgi:protein gp37
MADKSMISWCNSSWNPWVGCEKISEGCLNCYMYRSQIRFGKNPSKVVQSKTQRLAPLKWKTPRVIFVNSWSDFFIEKADDWRAEAWQVIRECQRHFFLILTKRPQNILRRLPFDWGDGYPNVGLGVTVESQDYMWRALTLKDIPSHFSFVSVEPILGFVDFGDLLFYFDWLICGGESGPGFRPAEVSWFRNLRVQCESFRVPFFFKQLGGDYRINGVWGGDLLEGEKVQQVPIPFEATYKFYRSRNFKP